MVTKSLRIKRFSLILFILFLVIKLPAQDFSLSFSGNGASTSVDSVKVENITQGKSIKLSGSETLHLLALVTGITPALDNEDYSLHIYPNPSNDYFTIDFGTRKPEITIIRIYDILGREIGYLKQASNVGINSFRIQGLRSGIYTVEVGLDNQVFSEKLISQSKSGSQIKINYIGNRGIISNISKLKSAQAEKLWQYNTGDRLKFIGISGKFSTVIMDIPANSKTIPFTFIACSDTDGNNYPIVQIGTQTWMAENLKTTKYNDGTTIPNVVDNATWTGLLTSAYCWLNNDAKNMNIYGALYNWYSIGTNKLAPTGWHIPADAEWVTLSNFLGGDPVSGGKLKEAGKTTYWVAPNTGATNEVGFTALPGGIRDQSGGIFKANATYGAWWTSTENGVTCAYAHSLANSDQKLTSDYFNQNYFKALGLSIRCILGTLNLPTISTLTITNITATGATLGGNVTSDGNATVTERGVVYATTQNPTTANTKVANGTGTGSFTSNITGLTAGTTYYVRAYAINNQGTAYGNQVTFTAGLTLSLATVTTTDASNITTTGATLGGNVTSDGNATVTERGVVYATTQNPTTANTKVANGTGTGSFTSNITGLTAGTTYYVRAYAINNQGTAYGNQVTFTAGLTLSLATETTTDASNITTTGATLGGNVTSDGNATVTERGVVYATTQNPTTSNTKVANGTGTGIFSSNITGLSAGTTYYVRAYAINSQGTAYGSPVIFTTSLTLSLATVTTTAASNITTTGVTLGGNVTSDGNATVTERGVVYAITQNPTTANTKAANGTGTGIFTSNVTGLTAGTTYYVRAYAINSQGTAYGSQVTFTTSLSLSLATVTTTAASNITTTGATLGGNVTSDGNATVTERGVVYATTQNPTTANTKVANGTGIGFFSSNLTGLPAGTTYYVRAYAINSQGTAYGNEINFIKNIGEPTVTTSSIITFGIDQGAGAFGGNVTSDNGHPVTSRGIYWNTKPSTLNAQMTVNGSGTGIFTSDIAGLTPNTTYYVFAYASNSAGTAYGDKILCVTDIDGNLYHTVEIGTQCWMVENLRTTHGSTGSRIYDSKLPEPWSSYTNPAFCWYTYNADGRLPEDSYYGAYYNWYAANMSDICPTGWHVPTDAEWTTLTSFLGGGSIAAGKLKETGTTHWQAPNTGTNESGFTLLPSGSRSGYSSNLYETGLNRGYEGYYWSSSQYDVSFAWFLTFYNDRNDLSRFTDPKSTGYSIRCVKD